MGSFLSLSPSFLLFGFFFSVSSFHFLLLLLLLLIEMDAKIALKNFELANNIQTTTDAIYQFNNDEQQQFLAQKPWSKKFVLSSSSLTLRPLLSSPSYVSISTHVSQLISCLISTNVSFLCVSPNHFKKVKVSAVALVKMVSRHHFGGGLLCPPFTTHTRPFFFFF